MADSSVEITAGTGTLVDTRTESTNANHRQVIVIGDPATNAGVAPVDVTAGLTVNTVPATSGGLSMYHVVSAATTNVANIKASAGQLYSVLISNRAAYSVYVKFHNTAGTPTAGSGVVRTVGVQSGVDIAVSLAPLGLTFATGIGISIVKGITDADAVAVALSDCVVDVAYK